MTLTLISVAYGNMPLSKQFKHGFPENTVIGKICMKQELHRSKESVNARLIGFAFPFLHLFAVGLFSRKVRIFVDGQCLNKNTFSAFGGKNRRNVFTYLETFQYNCLWAAFIIVENLLLLFLEVYSENISEDVRYALYHVPCFLFIDIFHGLYLPLKYLISSRDQFPILWSKEDRLEQNSKFYVRSPEIVPRRDFTLQNVVSKQEISRRTFFTLPGFIQRRWFLSQGPSQHSTVVNETSSKYLVTMDEDETLPTVES